MPADLPFAALLLDFDGTLVDSEVNWMRAENRLLTEYGVEWNEQRSMEFVGMALNDVGRATDWLGTTLAADQLTDDAIRAALLAEPSETTPLVLPFFTGERSTGWAAGARATMTGVSAATSATDIYRGVVEGIALSYGRVAGQLRPAAPDAVKIAAGGRTVAARPELFQAVSDVLGLPIDIVDAKRTTLLGTAYLALDTLAPGIERWRPEPGYVCEPHTDRAAYYAGRAAQFETLYDTLIAPPD